MLPRFCLVTDTTSPPDTIYQTVEEALLGGVRMVQYREKHRPRNERFSIAKKLRETTHRLAALFIVNDDIDLAGAVMADGVHLGQEDLPLSVARLVLGPHAIVGISTHNIEEAKRAESEGATYIGFGPVFRSPTKVSDSAPVGIEAISRVACRIGIPLYAIGGLQYVHLTRLIESGAYGVATVTGVSGDIRQNVRQWIQTLGHP